MEDELLENVILSTVIAEGSTVLIMGFITGLAVVVPNLLSVLLVAARALTVVSFVFLAHHLQGLGEGWRNQLEEQGI